MECPRCGNKDPAYFYTGSRGTYCRKCVGFKRVLLEEELYPRNYEVSCGVDEYHFEFELTPAQKKASRKCLEASLRGDVLLKCVCGAGKTEITVETISHYLKKRKRVCFAIARREVVIELTKRFEMVFPQAKVVGVYGGHHEEKEGDLIVCTTHQLYRYYQTFDLLIIDEVDAYPLSGDPTLLEISLNASKGPVIFSTATVDKQLESFLKRRKYETVQLNVRPSGRPLPVPEVSYQLSLFLMLRLYRILKKSEGQYIVFLPSRKETEVFYGIFKRLLSCTYVYSDLEERDEHIRDFKAKKYQHIFATTVLERGITIKGVSVIIFLSRRNIFSSSSLIQMLGRVGRGVGDTSGEAYILSNHYDEEVNETLDYLKEVNREVPVLR